MRFSTLMKKYLTQNTTNLFNSPSLSNWKTTYEGKVISHCLLQRKQSHACLEKN